MKKLGKVLIGLGVVMGIYAVLVTNEIVGLDYLSGMVIGLGWVFVENDN